MQTSNILSTHDPSNRLNLYFFALVIYYTHTLLCCIYLSVYWKDFPGGTSGKEPACQYKRHKRGGFDPWVGKIPWRRAGQPTPIFLPRVPHVQRNPAGYSHRFRKSPTRLKWLIRLSYMYWKSLFFRRIQGNSLFRHLIPLCCCFHPWNICKYFYKANWTVSVEYIISEYIYSIRSNIYALYALFT